MIFTLGFLTGIVFMILVGIVVLKYGQRRLRSRLDLRRLLDDRIMTDPPSLRVIADLEDDSA